MRTATSMFMHAMEQWLQCAQAGDFASARHHAENMVLEGELLVIHPDFLHRFQKYYPGIEPKDALVHFCQFLVCATDGAAVVLKKHADDNKPEVV